MEIGVLYLSHAMLVLAELIVCSTKGFACILAKWLWPAEISLSFTYGSPEASCNKQADNPLSLPPPFLFLKPGKCEWWSASYLCACRGIEMFSGHCWLAGLHCGRGRKRSERILMLTLNQAGVRLEYKARVQFALPYSWPNINWIVA